MKTKKPVTRTAATFDTIDVFDIRFKRINAKWKATVKYYLTSDSGERTQESYSEQIIVDSSEINKMEKLIAKIVNGK